MTNQYLAEPEPCAPERKQFWTVERQLQRRHRAPRGAGRCKLKFDAPRIFADFIALAYCMTSSALDSSCCGIVKPSALAAVRLMTRSNLVGCSTGRSAGLVPLRILST